MAFKGTIFDLDGVIVDTVPLHFTAWKHLFNRDFNLPFDLEIYEQKIDGKPRLDSVRLMLPQLTEEEVINAGEVKQAYYLKLLHSKQIKTFTAAFKLINELLQHDILLAAASSSKNTKEILEMVDLIDKFTAIITGYDFKRGKPDPEIFLNAATKLKLDPTECVVIEDSVAGVQAAKAGGFLCVGIDRHNKPQHYKLADLHVPNLKNVHYETLEKLF